MALIENCGRCLDQELRLMRKLEDMMKDVDAHQTRKLATKTAGTAVAVAGTVIGICLAPFTGGATLAITAVGLGVAGATTNVVTDWVDSNFTQKYMEEVHEIVEKKNIAAADLATDLVRIDHAIKLARQTGIVNKEMAVQVAIMAAAIPASKTAMESLIQDGTLGTLTKSEATGAGKMSELIATTAKYVGVNVPKVAESFPAVDGLLKLAPSVGKIAGRAIAVAGVAFNIVDTVQLVKDWHSEHPVMVALRQVLADIRHQVDHLEKFRQELLNIELQNQTKLIYSRDFPELTPIRMPPNNLVFQAVLLALTDWAPLVEILKSSRIDDGVDGDGFLDFLIRYAIAEGLTTELREDIENSIKARGRRAKELIKRLVKELIDHIRKERERTKDKDKKKRKLRGDHVINNGVLNVYRDIFFKFMQEELRNVDIPTSLAETSIIADVYEPVPLRIKVNIREVMVVHFENDRPTVDVNDALYGTVIGSLRIASVSHMRALYRARTFAPGTGTPYTAQIRTWAQQMNTGSTLGVPLFVDDAARAEWFRLNPGVNSRIYELTEPQVKQLFHNLYGKLEEWTRALLRAN